MACRVSCCLKMSRMHPRRFESPHAISNTPTLLIVNIPIALCLPILAIFSIGGVGVCVPKGGITM